MSADETIARLRATIEERDEEIRQLRERLAPSAMIPGFLRLSPQRADILAILLARSPAFVTYSSILALTKVHWRDAFGTSNNVSVQVCHLRRILKPYDILIDNRWGVGFSLPRESAGRLQALIDGNGKASAA
jgi:two-component system cell cycle response regulator CtrA